MHEFTMPAWATDRVVSRQGRARAHEDVPASRTALVIVDMQNHFMRPGGGGEAPMARAIVPNVNRLAAALRAGGGTVVWIRTLFTDEALQTIPHFHRILHTPERFEKRCTALARDAEDSQLWPGLEVLPQDLVIEKTRYSALARGASDLDEQLRARGIEAVLVGGTMTNACCDSTARDAMMLNYRTTMVHDCNASLRDDEHAAALINFGLFFGDVCGTDELVARYAGAGAEVAPAAE